MSSSLTSGTVGGALGNRCFYPEMSISQTKGRAIDDTTNFVEGQK